MRFRFKGSYSEHVLRTMEASGLTNEQRNEGIKARELKRRSASMNFHDEDVRTARQVGDVDAFRELTDQPLIGEST